MIFSRMTLALAALVGASSLVESRQARAQTPARRLADSADRQIPRPGGLSPIGDEATSRQQFLALLSRTRAQQDQRHERYHTRLSARRARQDRWIAAQGAPGQPPGPPPGRPPGGVPPGPPNPTPPVTPARPSR